MSFLGKWSFTNGTDSVQIDRSTGKVVVAATPTDGADRFNAYGTPAAFTLQASNGKFLSLVGTTYVADKSPSQPANEFTLVDAAGSTANVVDLGPTGAPKDHVLWNRNGAAIEPIPQAASPPATAAFTKTVVTPGVDVFMEQGFDAQQPDLSWVILAGTDFSAANLDLTQANLDHADCSSTVFSPGTPFQTATAVGADFSGATLVDCQFDGATLTAANFTKAKMAGIDLNGAKLQGATFTDADLLRAVNLASAVFDGGTLINTVFRGTRNIFETSFAGANLTGADFTGASVTGWMDITGADLTRASLCNPSGKVTVYPGNLRINAKTNFHRAALEYLDLTGYDLRDVNFAHADLTGCKLDGTQLDRTNFGFATLDGTTLTGGISMHGANFANASLRGADLTGAQLGAVSQIFRVGADLPAYTPFLAALKAGNVKDVTGAFVDNKRPLVGNVTVRSMVFAPDTAWQVQDASHVYSVFLETVGTNQSLDVYEAATPAVLANAFLVDVNLKSANLFGVRASGAQLYATAGKSVNLNLAKVNGLQANNANLGGIDLSQANLAGCNFDYAVLTGANFTGANLSVDANGGQPSFNSANLQGAKFDLATLRDVIFANAAVAVANPKDPTSAAGVWLFALDQDEAALLVPQLQAASPDPNAKPADAQHVFPVPIELLPVMTTTGPVPKGVAQAFADAKITLDKSALLVVLTTELFWSVTSGSDQYAVFRSVSGEYQPALGVASSEDYTIDADFYLPLSVEASLRNGAATKSVIDAFAAAGHPLAAGATVTTNQHPVVWQVVSGTDIYTLWIVFDSTVTGVDTTITARASIPNVVSVFGESSIALSARASIRRVDTGGWTIDNDAENPFNSSRGYIHFTVLPTEGRLDVYGSLMRIVRSTGPGTQEYTNVPCATTGLSLRELGPSGGTVCPNGATVAANQSDQLPFGEWMWARYLPRPPVCVPDPQGKFFCPT